MVYAVEENLCLVMLVNPQFEYGVSNYSTSQARYTSKKYPVSLIKSFFFLFKFSNWLSSGWVSVHLKLGADINQQKPRSVCVANAVITLLDMRGALKHQVWCGGHAGTALVSVPWSCLAVLLPWAVPVLLQC